MGGKGPVILAAILCVKSCLNDLRDDEILLNGFSTTYLARQKSARHPCTDDNEKGTCQNQPIGQRAEMRNMLSKRRLQAAYPFDDLFGPFSGHFYGHLAILW